MSELKPQRYKEERPAEQFQYVHEYSRTHQPNWVYELVRLILTPIALLLYRTRAIKPDNIPASGPVILAPNHFSNMDHFFAGVYTRRKIRFMAKSQLFGQNRILDYIFVKGGVFPVMRGHHDQEAFITAHSILDQGGCVLMYAEGGRSRSGQLGEAKAGVALLEAPRLPEGHRPVRRADRLPGQRAPDPRRGPRCRARDLRSREGDVRAARGARPRQRDQVTA